MTTLASVPVRAGLIGHGRFGALLRSILEPGYAVTVYDPAQPQWATPEQLAAACAADVVFLCVPIVAFEDSLRAIGSLLNRSALVVDVLSVKEFAYDAMVRLLPPEVGLLPTHPMFGPDAAKAGLSGLPFVLCPQERTPAVGLAALRAFLQRKGLRTVEMSCEEHDRVTARSLCLTQLLGRALDRLDVQASCIDTASFGHLLNIRRMAVNDSWQLFEGLQRQNRFAARMRDEFAIALSELQARLAPTQS